MTPGVYVNFMGGDEDDRFLKHTSNAGSVW